MADSIHCPAPSPLRRFVQSRTQTIAQTLRPIWDATFSVPCKGDEQITGELYDEDKRSKNDLLATFRMDCKALSSAPINGWIQLCDKKGVVDRKLGQIRVRAFVEPNATKVDTKARDAKFRALVASETEGKVDPFLEVFVGTWNVGNAAPADDLSPWIPKDKRYPLYVIGAQECTYKPRKGFSSCEKDWFGTLQSHLGSDYINIASCSLGEMRLACFCLAGTENQYQGIKTAVEATGIAHVGTNKGGIALSFSYYDTSILFVTAHLAAHQDMCARRNSDVKEILSDVSNNCGELPQSDCIADHDYVVFMGDLNYRLDFGDQGMSREPSKEQYDQMVRMVGEKKFSALFATDQLVKEMKKGAVFAGFVEGKYDFEPSFKVERSSELKYNKKRSPAWCDRVLWHNRGAPLPDIKQTSLGVGLSVPSSDHKPVFTTLQIPVSRLPAISSLVGDVKCTIRFDKLGARGLPAMDSNGLCDAYVEFMGNSIPTKAKRRTDVVKKNLNPDFKKVPDIVPVVTSPARLPLCRLVAKVFDKDQWNKDDIVGCAAIPLADLLPNGGVPEGQKSISKTSDFRVRITNGGEHVGNGAAVLLGTTTVTYERI